MPPDRLYHHLARLEEVGLITIAEYRPLPGGKVERVYAAAEVEPPGDEASPEDTARAELLAAFERLIREAKAKESPDGTWTRITWTLADAEDRRLRE